MHTAPRIAGIVAGLSLSVAALAAPSYAGDDTGSGNEPAACAQEQKQLDKANDALARVTAVFEHQQEKVKKAKKDVKAADDASEERQAERALEHAKADRDAAKKDKKAQQQRVAKAQERLDECQAEQPAA